MLYSHVFEARYFLISYTSFYLDVYILYVGQLICKEMLISRTRLPVCEQQQHTYCRLHQTCMITVMQLIWKLLQKHFSARMCVWWWGPMFFYFCIYLAAVYVFLKCFTCKRRAILCIPYSLHTWILCLHAFFAKYLSIRRTERK